jgi:hypothetical protein
VTVYEALAEPGPLDRMFTWNGEAIRSKVWDDGWYSALEGFSASWRDDLDPMNPHHAFGSGASDAQAICDLVSKLVRISKRGSHG